MVVIQQIMMFKLAVIQLQYYYISQIRVLGLRDKKRLFYTDTAFWLCQRNLGSEALVAEYHRTNRFPVLVYTELSKLRHTKTLFVQS